MGFDAVWISPITKQIDDASRAYHGYSQVDAYSLNSNFGNAADLHNLADALHSRGMVSIDFYRNVHAFSYMVRLLLCYRTDNVDLNSIWWSM